MDIGSNTYSKCYWADSHGNHQCTHIRFSNLNVVRTGFCGRLKSKATIFRHLSKQNFPNYDEKWGKRQNNQQLPRCMLAVIDKIKKGFCLACKIPHFKNKTIFMTDTWLRLVCKSATVQYRTLQISSNFCLYSLSPFNLWTKYQQVSGRLLQFKTRNYKLWFLLQFYSKFGL